MNSDLRVTERISKETPLMVRKETCANCKGNRVVEVKPVTPGKASHIRCPHCGGTGYKVRLTR